MEKVYKIKSEWDLGINNKVFKSAQLAHKWLTDNINPDNFGFNETLEELMKDNLIQIQSLELIGELKTVTISQEMYDELINDQAFLDCLKGAGVDNWEGYSYAWEMMDDNN